jgi:hypothetical protein
MDPRVKPGTRGITAFYPKLTYIKKKNDTLLSAVSVLVVAQPSSEATYE